MIDLRFLSGIRRTGVFSKSFMNVLSYSLKRAIGFPYAHLHEVARRSQTLCDAGEVPAITPFFWEKHLPRIYGAAKHNAEHVIKHYLNRKIFEFRPVVAYWLKDASLFGGSIYLNRYRQELRFVGCKPWEALGLNGPVAEIEQGAIVSTCAGSTWWGHWIEDEVPLQMLAEKFATPITHVRKVYRDEMPYRSAFGIVEPQCYGVALVSELLVIDEFAQNPDKTRRYHTLRQRLAQLPQGYERVFLSRSDSGVRRMLVNEAEVRSRLESMGFKTINVSSSNADEVIAACRGADIVVSVEGSHLAPLLYQIRDFGKMIILNPPYQVHTTIADIGVFCGLSSGMFICQPDGESRTDFRADPDELARFVEETAQYGEASRPKLESFLDHVMSMGTPFHS